MSGHQMKETAPSTEGKIHWGFVVLFLLMGGLCLSTVFSVGSVWHLPDTKWGFAKLSLFFLSLSLTMSALAFAFGSRPGRMTFMVALLGVACLYYGLYFFA